MTPLSFIITYSTQSSWAKIFEVVLMKSIKVVTTTLKNDEMLKINSLNDDNCHDEKLKKMRYLT